MVINRVAHVPNRVLRSERARDINTIDLFVREFVYVRFSVSAICYIGCSANLKCTERETNYAHVSYSVFSYMWTPIY